MNIAVELEKLVPEVRKIIAERGEYKARAEKAEAVKDEVLGPLTVKCNDLTREMTLAEHSRQQAQDSHRAAILELRLVETVLVEATQLLRKNKIQFDPDKVRRGIAALLKS